MMEFISIFNDVLGPVMRGPSSSHTAGSYHISRIARSLLAEPPAAVIFTFDPNGSYVNTYRQQASDLAFAAGIMEWPLIDERFPKALDVAANQGIQIEFRTERLTETDHPNAVEIKMNAKSGKKIIALAKSTGGGGVVFSLLDGRPIFIDGKSFTSVILCEDLAARDIQNLFSQKGKSGSYQSCQIRENEVLISIQRPFPLDGDTLNMIESMCGVKQFWTSSPVFFVQRGEPLFSSSFQMIDLAQSRSQSLGQIALAYEAQLLGISEEEALAEMERRYEIMRSSLRQGLGGKAIKMKLLQPSARDIFQAESTGKVAIGGLHTRVAAGALAVLHVSNSQGIVCAAPTGGSAGVIPGVVVTLSEERGLSSRQSAMALFAGGAIGLIVARQATFAAEVAGCQVEIGAAGAMAAAAVVELAGGRAQQAADAAAVSFQNTMGSVCDLVQGICEIPCHTRNAVAASSALVCADLIMGGYVNPIPLDETINAVLSSGRMLPPQLRCTALGGLAITPSALKLPRL